VIIAFAWQRKSSWNEAVDATLIRQGISMHQPLLNVRILLVEDDPLIGLDLRETLEMAGAKVVGPARDASSATALMEDHSFDVAVLDHIIVGGDSLPLARELTQRGLRFIFHTSHRGTLSQQFPQARVIDKPSRPGELVAALTALLRSATK
jgi:DNA-binding response OmpR family regulator